MLKLTARMIIAIAIAVQLYVLNNTIFQLFGIQIQSKILFSTVNTVLSFGIGYALACLLLSLIQKASIIARNNIEKYTNQEMMSGIFGLVIGLLLAVLVGNSIYKLPYVGPYFYVLVSIFLAYMGWLMGMKRKDYLTFLVPNLKKSKLVQKGMASIDKLVDTSVIIDGRIADIAKSGFIDGDLIVPSFVLEELQKIADSSDTLKRNRGRRGLDILNRMQKEPGVNLKVVETSAYAEFVEVDAMLVKMGQDKGMPILTNDYNLNKVAQLQGVKVLNINELSNAVKPVVLPGEEFELTVLKEGKEANQGIGYLDDGTMVVVENGKKLVGDHIDVMVTSILQTAAGRMIFVKPKELE